MGGNATFEEPSDVDAEEGQVLVDGPDGLAFAMTPDAAEETGRRLISAASEARSHARRDVNRA